MTGVEGLVGGLVVMALAGGPGGAGWDCSFNSWVSSLADIFCSLSASTTGASLEKEGGMRLSMEPGGQPIIQFTLI